MLLLYPGFFSHTVSKKMLGVLLRVAVVAALVAVTAAVEVQWGGYRTYGAVTRLAEGSVVEFDVDISIVPCGMVAALYYIALPLASATATSAPSSSSSCATPYCDANALCGMACAELDLMEANRHAFRSTVHASTDHSGQGMGQGGFYQDDLWPRGSYGVRGSCIDTGRTFRVAMTYVAQGPRVVLSQDSCKLNMQLPTVPHEFSLGANIGVTPVLSLWGSPSTKANNNIGTKWLDGGACRSTYYQQQPTITTEPDPSPPTNVTFSVTPWWPRLPIFSGEVTSAATSGGIDDSNMDSSLPPTLASTTEVVVAVAAASVFSFLFCSFCLLGHRFCTIKQPQYYMRLPR